MAPERGGHWQARGLQLTESVPAKHAADATDDELVLTSNVVHVLMMA